ncbi:MAG: hypothetical protein QF464_08870, partial [Myxococcota bacterium]|nr:hypothetical protein [Myxococcota bacterium]
KVRDIAASPEDGNHLVAITSRKVWETRDWGETWTAVYRNDSEWWFRDVRFDPHEAGVFWIVSTNEVLRVSESRKGSVPMGALAAYRARLDTEPSLWETMEATFTHFGVHLGEHAEIRERAMPAGWAPRVSVMGGVMSGNADARLRLALFEQPVGGDPNTAFFERAHAIDDFYVFGVLEWDLGIVALDLDAVPYGRVFNTASYRYRKLRAEVQRLYEERQRLLLELLTSPRRDLVSDLFLRLRLEELTAHLDAYTGGLWEPSARWLAALP